MVGICINLISYHGEVESALEKYGDLKREGARVDLKV